MDLPTWNTLNSCCDCGFPTCEEPTALCQSLSHTSTCADDDYTDDYAEWEIGLNAWLSELIDAWEADLAAWLAEDPDRVAEDYPVPAPDPRDPDDYTTPAPTKPDGYDDVTHGCFLPYVRPDGLASAEIPTIYRTYVHTIITNQWSGDGYNYQSFDFGAGAGRELLGHSSYAAGVETITTSGTETDGVTCTALTDPGTEVPPYPGSVTWVDGEPELVCTESSRTYSQVDTSTSGTIPLTLQGCPGPFSDSYVEAWDFTQTNSDTQTLGSGISKSDLLDRAVANLPSTWPDTAEGSSCVASTVATWPIISDGFVGADPEADPPVEGAWPTCEADLLISGSATSTATKVRYKRGIPLKYQAHRLWIDAHAAWVIAHADWVTAGSDPDTEPEEPAEPQIFHYYAEQWDVVKFPKAWEAWRLLYVAWKAAVAAHAAWVIAHAAWVDAGSDPDTEPEEPVVPDDPSADQPDDRPVFIDENLFWEWTGGETLETQYETDWRFIDAVGEECRIAVVNSQVMCFQSERTGVPPTPFGEIYNVDDFPA